MSNLDLVTLVNERDEVIGAMDKVEGHKGEAKLHRAISVYLFRKNKVDEDATELLIQQRSSKKILGAHQWANTVCGNVRPTENYEECAFRRLREELGITEVSIEPIYKFEYHLQCNAEFSEWEMDQVFVGWYNGEVKPNPKEAQDYAWVNWNNLKEQEKNAQLETQNYKTKKITVINHLGTDLLNQELGPWFVWMMNDKKLIQIINKEL